MSGQDLTKVEYKSEEYNELVKPISAALLVNENSVPSVIAHGHHDKIALFESVVRVVDKLKEYGIDHKFIEFPHSGHGLQNDDKQNIEYMKTIEEYLEKYLPVN